jgi:hypothetical protein
MINRLDLAPQIILDRHLALFTSSFAAFTPEGKIILHA